MLIVFRHRFKAPQNLQVKGTIGLRAFVEESKVLVYYLNLGRTDRLTFVKIFDSSLD